MELLNNAIKKKQMNYELDFIYVEEVDDGGMGGLKFLIEDKNDRFFGEILSSVRFNDEDGVSVIATLNLDDKGNLYELDIWKTDFSPLCHPLNSEYKILGDFS